MGVSISGLLGPHSSCRSAIACDYKKNFSQQFSRTLKKNTFLQAVVDIASRLPFIERTSPNLLNEFNEMARILQQEIRPYLNDPLCPPLLTHLDEQIRKIMNPKDGLEESVRAKLSSTSFEYFFGPIPDAFEYKGACFKSSLFMADALTLLQNIQRQKETITAIRSGQKQLPSLTDTQLLVNGTVITSANVYNKESKSYEPAIAYEGELTNKILIQDEKSDSGGVFVSLVYFNGIRKSIFSRNHPLTRRRLSQCKVSVLIPIQNQPRAFMGVEVQPHLFNALDELFTQLGDVARHSLFLKMPVEETENYETTANKWMTEVTEEMHAQGLGDDAFLTEARNDREEVDRAFESKSSYGWPLTENTIKIHRFYHRWHIERKAITHSVSMMLSLMSIYSKDDLERQLKDNDELRVGLARFLELMHIKNTCQCLWDRPVESVPTDPWDVFQELKQYNA